MSSPTELEKQNFITNYRVWYNEYYLSGMNLKNKEEIDQFNSEYRIQINYINEFLKNYYKNNKSDIDQIAFAVANEEKEPTEYEKPTELEKQNFITNYRVWYTGYYLSGMNLKNKALVNLFNSNYRIQLNYINEFLKKYYKNNKSDIDKIALESANKAIENRKSTIEMSGNVYVDFATLRKMLLEVMKLSDEKNVSTNKFIIQQYNDRISDLNSKIINLKNKIDLNTYNKQLDLAKEDYYIILSKGESSLVEKKYKTTNDMLVLQNIQTLKNNLISNNPTLFTVSKITDLTTKVVNKDYVVQEYFTYEDFVGIGIM